MSMSLCSFRKAIGLLNESTFFPRVIGRKPAIAAKNDAV
jgi:hypothetical protein